MQKPSSCQFNDNAIRIQIEIAFVEASAYWFVGKGLWFWVWMDLGLSLRIFRLAAVVICVLDLNSMLKNVYWNENGQGIAFNLFGFANNCIKLLRPIRLNTIIFMVGCVHWAFILASETSKYIFIHIYPFYLFYVFEVFGICGCCCFCLFYKWLLSF